MRDEPWQKLQQTEEATAVRVTDACRGLFSYLELIYNTIHVVVKLRHSSLSREKKLTKFVGATLLVRLADDLRVLTIAAKYGYGTQALALATSVYEVAHSIMTMKGDDDAVQWLFHQQPHRPFRTIKSITQEAYSDRDAEKNDWEDAYFSYAQLCMAKHAHPLFEQYRCRNIKNRLGIRKPGPNTSKLGYRDLVIAMYLSAEFARQALGRYIETHRCYTEELFKKVPFFHVVRDQVRKELMNKWNITLPEEVDIFDFGEQQQSEDHAQGR